MKPHLPRTTGAPHSSGAEQTVWFISFGDLLTLLLCFFLVLTPWDKLGTLPNSDTKQAVSAPAQAGQGVGTTLAAGTGREEPVTVLEIPLTGELLASADGVAEARLLMALEERLVEHETHAGLQLAVALCAEHEERGEVLRRVSMVLLAAEFSDIPLSVEVGGSCPGAPEGAAGTERRVGMVRLIRT